MRHIGNLPDQPQAQKFSDYLEAVGFDTHVSEHAGRWSVWIREEDQVDQAREHFQRFVAQPDDAEMESYAARTRQRREARTIEVISTANEQTATRRLPTLRGIARRAPLTTALIGLCLFVAMTTDFGTNFNSATMQSLTFENPSHIYEDGWDESGGWARDIRNGELWRLATPIFLHFGWMHVVFDLLLLFQLGYLYETRSSSWMLGFVILITGVAGNLGQYLCDSSSLFGGFSGVIFGLVAFAWVRMRLAPGEGLRIPNEPVWLLLIFLVVGFTGSLDGMVNADALQTKIANWSHLFGLVAGGILAAALPRTLIDD